MFVVLPYGVDRPLYRRPDVTYALLAVNAVVFALHFLLIPMTASGGREAVIQAFIDRFGFSSISERPWTLLTHQFVHGGWFHFFWNMYFLYLIGAVLEDRIGRGRLVLLYLVGGCAGALVQKGLMNDSLPLVGASGSIAALAGAFFIVMPWCDFKILYFIWALFRVYSGTTKTPSVFLLGLYFFLVNVVDAFASRSGNAGVSVAYWSHVGGFAFGAVLAASFYGLRAFAHSEAELQLEEARVQLALSRAIREKEDGTRRSIEPPAPSQPGPPDEPNPAVLEEAVTADDTERAAHEFRRLLQRNPSFSLAPVMQFALVELLVKANMKDLALVASDNLVNVHPRSVQANAGLLVAGRLAKENPTTSSRAMTYIQRFLRTNPTKESRAEAERLIEELSGSLGQMDVSDFSPETEEEAPDSSKFSSSLPSLASAENADRDNERINLDLDGPPVSGAAPHAAPRPASGVAPYVADVPIPAAAAEPDESGTRKPLHISLDVPKETGPVEKREVHVPESPVRAISLGEILGERHPAAPPGPTQETDGPEEETEKIVRSAVSIAARSLDGDDSAHITDSGILRPPNQDRKHRVSAPDASCSLIVSPRREIDFRRLLYELSSILDRPFQTLADRLRLQCGIVLHDVPYAAGVEIRDRLRGAGLPIRLVENRKSLDFAARVETLGLQVHPDRLVWRTASGDLEMAARGIGLLACGQVRLSPDSAHHSTAVDVFQMHPVQHVRLWEGSFSLGNVAGIEGIRSFGLGLADMQGLRRLAHYLAQLSHETVQTYAMREWLSHGAPHGGTVEPRTFRHIGSYDDYNRWHILAYFAEEVE